jgi:hypothetical protein
LDQVVIEERVKARTQEMVVVKSTGPCNMSAMGSDEDMAH